MTITPPGETPPRSSSTARSGAKQLREVDGIDTMCVSVLAFREGNKKGLRTRRDTRRESRWRKKWRRGRRRGAWMKKSAARAEVEAAAERAAWVQRQGCMRTVFL